MWYPLTPLIIGQALFLYIIKPLFLSRKRNGRERHHGRKRSQEEEKVDEEKRGKMCKN